MKLRFTASFSLKPAFRELGCEAEDLKTRLKIRRSVLVKLILSFEAFLKKWMLEPELHLLTSHGCLCVQISMKLTCRSIKSQMFPMCVII